MNNFRAFLSWFNFVDRWRKSHQALLASLTEASRQERLAEAEEKRLEREHQLALAKTFMNGLTAMQDAQREAQEVQTGGLMEIAKAISAQAESFGKWIALFQTSGPATSSVVRDEDEVLRDQMKLLDAGMPAELADLPEELRLAWALKNDPNWMDIGPNTV